MLGSPPVWWKIGEAAPDWLEKDVAKDRPALSWRFEADPFREDCKENSVTTHIHNNMLKGINLDMGIIILGNMKIIEILNKVVIKQILSFYLCIQQAWGIKSSTKTANLNIIN